MKKWQTRIVGYDNVNPEELCANPLNWRIHPRAQQAALKGILDEVGWVQEVMVNQRSGFVVDGHARVALALRDGQGTVPVKYVDLSPDEEAKVLAALDPIGAMAGTDHDKLTELLHDVSTGDEGLMSLLSQIADPELSRPPDPIDMGLDGDDDDEPGEEVIRGDSDGSLLALVDVTIADPTHVVKRGDVWRLGDRHVLVCASVAEGHAVWAGHLTPERLFCPYPGPFAPLTIKAEGVDLLMVQPNPYIAGHILDRYVEVKGKESVRRD